MNKTSTHILAAAMAMLLPIGAHAQEALRSGYFLDGYLYRHQMNPAYYGERNYISFPVLGNLNVGSQSTVGVSNFLYKMPNGQLTTFMNSSVSSSEFLGGLKNNNRLSADINETILSAGFFSFGGYNTVEINVRSSTSFNLPKELFAFMKEGMSSSRTVYDIGDMGISSTNYAEIALGHSRNVIENLNVGVKVKFLIGLAQARVKMKDMKVTMTDQEWKVEAQGEMEAGVKGLIMPTNEEAGRDYNPEANEADLISWDDVDYDKFGLNGGGFAIDLGATYKVRDDLELSFAITDLGFLKWKNGTIGRTADSEWSFRGFDEVSLTSDGDNQLDDEFNNLGDELGDFFNFHKDGSSSGKSHALGATMSIGALYTLPFYDGKLKAGFLSTTRINGKYSWSEARVSANWYPCKVFDASISYAGSTFGHSFGWIVNVHPKGFNLFLGSDHQFLHITPQFIPVKRANTNLSIGINFPFGNRRSL